MTERIALFGGTFDPPHEGHVHVARAARDMLRADKVLWLVTPLSPHKKHAPPAHDYRKRFALSKSLTRDIPYVTVSDIERRAGCTATVDTVRHILSDTKPGRRYVWVAGSDVIPSFHLWKEADALAKLIPFAFVARGDGAFDGEAYRNSVFFRSYKHRIHDSAPEKLFYRAPPAMQLLRLPPNPASSSALRAASGA